MTISTTTRFGLTRWSADSDDWSRAAYDGNMAAIETLGAMYSQGTLAARPAPSKAGRFYTATDQSAPAQNLFYDNGAAWVEWRPDLTGYATSSALSSGLAGKAAAVHTHATSDITSGLMATARLGSGTASSSTVLFGDQTYKAIPGGSIAGLSDVTIGTPAAGFTLRYDTGTSKWVAQLLGIGDVSGLTSALAGKAASSHTHAIADLPVASSGVSDVTKLVRSDDVRLADARTPLAHTHAIADLPVASSGVSSSTQLVRADDARLADSRTPLAHTHAIADLPVASSGVSDVTKLVRSDDARLADARTPVSHVYTLVSNFAAGVAASPVPGRILAQLNATSGGNSNSTTTDTDIDAAYTLTFIAPASGNVTVEFEGLLSISAGASGTTTAFWTVREATTTLKAATMGNWGFGATPNTITQRLTARFAITGLTPGSSHTYKWGHYLAGIAGSVQVTAGATQPALLRVVEAA